MLLRCRVRAWTCESEKKYETKYKADLARWRERARNTVKAELRLLNAAHAATEGAVSFMVTGHGDNMYREAAVLRQMLARWDSGNWAELCVLALKGCQVDKTPEISQTVAFCRRGR